MNSAAYNRSTHDLDTPAFSAISPSVPAPSEPSASYLTDHKADPSTFGSHPADSAQHGDSMTTEDAQYLRKQVAELKAFPTGAGSLPVKSKRELHPQPETIDIVPDQNPLSPTFLSRPILSRTNTLGLASDAAIDTHLPGQAIHANQQMKGGTWKYGLCDCGDIGVCCTGVWCPCIIYGKTQYRLSQRSERKDPTNLLGYSIFNGSCAAFALFCGCNFILAAIQHSRVRKAYGIPGGVGTDFVRACCCCCCTLSQDEKEIKFRENQARRPSGSTSQMQYTSPLGMDFSAPPK
jgi:Cys-rich protein (TIGR01571 family)